MINFSKCSVFKNHFSGNYVFKNVIFLYIISFLKTLYFCFCCRSIKIFAFLKTNFPSDFYQIFRIFKNIIPGFTAENTQKKYAFIWRIFN